jgi:hypothetical protein
MSPASRRALTNMLAAQPDAGDLIVGSGGIRKVRLAGEGKGKSGGYRVLTAFVGPMAPVYRLAVLSKGDRENFTRAEVQHLAKLTASIRDHWRERRSRSET